MEVDIHRVGDRSPDSPPSHVPRAVWACRPRAFGIRTPCGHDCRILGRGANSTRVNSYELQAGGQWRRVTHCENTEMVDKVRSRGEQGVGVLRLERMTHLPQLRG